MDFQDILFFLIFLIFSILPKKRKPDVLEENEEEKNIQVEQVRKKIEAIKSKRNPSNFDKVHAPDETVESKLLKKTNQEDFSKPPLPIYKQPVYECEPPKIEKSPICLKTKISKPKALQNTLREGMKWHIILSKPVCTRSLYGNFTNR